MRRGGVGGGGVGEGAQNVEICVVGGEGVGRGRGLFVGCRR